MFRSLYIFLAGLAFIGCQGETTVRSADKHLGADSLIAINRSRAMQESAIIDGYVKRRQLEVIRTGTGLRYRIDSLGQGPNIKVGQRAVLRYRSELLDGTLCYKTDGHETVSFVVDHDHVESGLHEGIKFMRQGDKALFILPSHLAHGLAGDQDKIPPLAPVVFYIELVAIQ